MSRVRHMRWYWALMLVLPLWAHAAVQASLDRSRVALGDTVTLNLRVQNPGSGQAPDLSPLASDFTILGMSSNNSISIVNGQRSDELTYGIALRPNHVGHLTIPALAVDGQHTNALHLEVTAADNRATAQAERNVFVQVQSEPGTVHVGEQLVLTVQLYYVGALSSASLSPPQVAGAEIRRLGDDINYDTQRGGRSFHVIEQRYAVIPRHPGPMQIAPFVFQGEMVDPADPDSFFGMGTPVTASSPSVTVKVMPPPPDWGSSAWLPARELELTLDGLPADGKARVGQPLQLTMTLQARGLPYEALPALTMPDVYGAKVYPDKPDVQTTASGLWMIGRRQQSFAVVPDRPGTLVIPATIVKWWNVQTGKAELATIAQHRLTVLPAVGAVTTKPAKASSAPTALARAATSRHATPRRSVAGGFRWAVVLAVLLLVAALLATWWWRRRAAPAMGAGIASPTGGRSAPAVDASPRARRAAFMTAARGGTPAEQVACLLAWARAERPGFANLGEVAAALASSPQRVAIAQLQQRHYAGRDTDGAPALEPLFADGFAWREETPDRDESGLAPLYPFKLR